MTEQNHAMQMQELWRRLERWATIHAPRMLEDLAGPATEAELLALERALDRRLPLALRTSLQRHNGEDEAEISILAHYGDLLPIDNILRHWQWGIPYETEHGPFGLEDPHAWAAAILDGLWTVQEVTVRPGRRRARQTRDHRLAFGRTSRQTVGTGHRASHRSLPRTGVHPAGGGAARMAARSCGSLPGTWQLRRGRRGLAKERESNIRRKLHICSHDLEQYLVIFRLTVVRFKPSHQCQGVLRTQIDLLNMFQELEESKHYRLHLQGDDAQSLQSRELV
jgi:hypothetical protein